MCSCVSLYHFLLPAVELVCVQMCVCECVCVCVCVRECIIPTIFCCLLLSLSSSSFRSHSRLFIHRSLFVCLQTHAHAQAHAHTHTHTVNKAHALGLFSLNENQTHSDVLSIQLSVCLSVVSAR